MKGNNSTGVLLILAVIGGLLFGAGPFHASAEVGFPGKPITIIVPFPAGGSTDMAVRGIATYTGKYLNTDIMVQNIPGLDGVIGYAKAYSAKPDGYTLLATNTLPQIFPEFSRETKYKSLDFKSVFAFARDSVILVERSDGPRTFDEFVKTARNETIKIGTTGRATTTGLMGILLVEELGLKVNWIFFNGGEESLTALAGKQVDAVFSIAASALPKIKTGKIRPLAVFSEKHYSKYPDVPIPRELGIEVPLLYNYSGIVAPPGTPDEPVKTLEAAFGKAAVDREYVEWFKKTAVAEPLPLTAGEYRKEFERLYVLAEKYKKYLKE